MATRSLVREARNASKVSALALAKAKPTSGVFAAASGVVKAALSAPESVRDGAQRKQPQPKPKSPARAK